MSTSTQIPRGSFIHKMPAITELKIVSTLFYIQHRLPMPIQCETVLLAYHCCSYICHCYYSLCTLCVKAEVWSFGWLVDDGWFRRMFLIFIRLLSDHILKTCGLDAEYGDNPNLQSPYSLSPLILKIWFTAHSRACIFSLDIRDIRMPSGCVNQVGYKFQEKMFSLSNA